MIAFVIDNQRISLQEFEHICNSNCEVVLGKQAITAINKGYSFLHKKTNNEESSYYGINTGFGALCNTIIPEEQQKQLQLNLIKSHACGMGAEVPEPIVKRMLLLKVIALSKGYSGVHLETVNRLLFFYNHSILPIVYEQGSLGASGDLAPLAHLCLPLIGEGEVRINGEKISGDSLSSLFSIPPLTLHAKEGLALLNGTQFMAAYASFSVQQGFNLFEEGLKIASLSLEAFDGRIEPFQENVNALRQQKGQIIVAEKMRSYLTESSRHKAHVQDPYSFRCIPQVHGASWDTLVFCSEIVENEINAVTDNPTLFPDEDQIVSAGNFHGQPLALSMDFLAIALAELGSIAERRIYKLISGSRDLPPFLVKEAGLNSGFMIVQYSAASIVSQNKQLCTPASIDTIDSSNGQEDHVSMGANAATKLHRVIENIISIQALEWLCAAQAFDFRTSWKLSGPVQERYQLLRNEIPFMAKDRYIHPDMKSARRLLENLVQAKH